MSEQLVINVEDIQEKLYEKLKPSGWGRKLRDFIMSMSFQDILNFLVGEYNAGRRFTPPLKYIFRAFEECPYDKLKVVMILMDPYPQLNTADGIPMSCSLTQREQPSLKFVFDSIERFYQLENYSRDVDLKRWSNQGVLLLNSALTAQLGLSGKHLKEWRKFTGYLLDVLNTDTSGLVFVFMGRDAQEFADLIGPHHHKILVSHPASAAYRQDKFWDDQGIWGQIDSFIFANYQEKIMW